MPTFVCPPGVDCSNVSASAQQNESASNRPDASSASGGALLVEAAAGEPASQPEVRIEEVRLPKSTTPLHEPLEVRALLSAGDVSPQSLHVALYDGHPDADGQIFDVEVVPYLRANDAYQIRASYRPEACGPHDIFVVTDPGAGLDPATGTASVNVSIDPASEIAALRGQLAATALPYEEQKRIARTLEAARHAFRRGKVGDGLEELEDLERHIRRLGGGVPAPADAIEARVQAVAACIFAAGGKVAEAGKQKRQRYRWQ